MPKRLVLTRQARRDLRSIHQYIAKDSPANADRFLADLTAKIEWIAEIEFAGLPRDHIRSGLRAFPYRGRCFYFRHTSEEVVFLRVVHGAQDISRIDF